MKSFSEKTNRGDDVVQSFCSFSMVLRLQSLVEIPKLHRDTPFFFGRLPHLVSYCLRNANQRIMVSVI